MSTITEAELSELAALRREKAEWRERSRELEAALFKIAWNAAAASHRFRGRSAALRSLAYAVQDLSWKLP